MDGKDYGQLIVAGGIFIVQYSSRLREVGSTEGTPPLIIHEVYLIALGVLKNWSPRA